MKIAMAYYYSPARACSLLLLLQPVYYLWFMAPHTSALSFSYNFSNPGDLDRANLTCLGNSTAGDGIVNLTNGANSTGRVAYPQTVRLWDDRTGRRASFTTDFSFAINISDTHDRGDGMAFFIGVSRPGPPKDSNGEFLGLFSNPENDPSPQHTVGVEFDTNNNGDWDAPLGVFDHIGIDVNSVSKQVYKGLGKAFPNPLSGNMSAKVKYDGKSKVLYVSLWLADRTIYELNTSVDLKAEGVPRDATIGFSAATFNYYESHQLLSWSFDSTDPSKLELWVVILLAGASVSFAALVAALLWVVIVHRQRRARTPSIEIALQVARQFSYRELSLATNNFSQDRKLGAGQFGEVYKGELPDKPTVAVKRLMRQMEARTQSDYKTEIMTLGRLSHRNLVKLVGWCHGGGNGELLLVYELVTNGSLDEHLHGSQRLLTWPERYRILRGIGSAVEYLHNSDGNPILHRDIKPSNVMLDDELEAKLGDFGLVRQMAPRQGSLGGTAMAGDMAYLDPVCVSKDTVSVESDVYSFGVLLLEIATGKKPAAVLGTGGLSNTLVNAVRESYAKGDEVLRQMADERLNGDFDESQMERVLVVGLLCVQQQREHRPKIRDAVNLLLSDLSHPVPQILS